MLIVKGEYVDLYISYFSSKFAWNLGFWTWLDSSESCELSLTACPPTQHADWITNMISGFSYRGHRRALRKVKAKPRARRFCCFLQPAKSSFHIDFSEWDQLVGLLWSSVTSAAGAIRKGAHITHGRWRIMLPWLFHCHTAIIVPQC